VLYIRTVATNSLFSLNSVSFSSLEALEPEFLHFLLRPAGFLSEDESFPKNKKETISSHFPYIANRVFTASFIVGIVDSDLA